MAGPSDIEGLGLFYLGREVDSATSATQQAPLLYPSKNLMTHAVCMGMTGSGKTGLCIGLLEEAALDGIGAIAIDPKGDLANLLLTFPSLRGEDFLPWVDAEEAKRKGVEPKAQAEQEAARWKEGLAKWGQDGERIQRLRDAVEVNVFTPGSSAGRPLSIVSSLAPPPPAVLQDGELFRERVATAASSLLSLAEVSGAGPKSREHILLSALLSSAWTEGRALDFPALISAIQDPPMARVGVLDIESFFPAKERFELVLSFNNLLASPGFGAWTEGEPLDISRLLSSPDGKPRLSVISIAHLGDAERMFFVSLLLNEVLGWVRQQPGTQSLRALLFMDEIFGYFPPVEEPPSKRPLLTLLKQARAFGLGLVLATQNPVDLDYKGLANAGTWFIGRLQTERDRERLLQGLLSASGSGGQKLDEAALNAALGQLRQRVFLLHDVREDAPTLFETRWTLSYLKGPLTREELRRVSQAARADEASPASGASPQAVPSRGPVEATKGAASARPSLPPDVPQYFAPWRGAPGTEGKVTYVPALLAAGQVGYSDAKLGVNDTQSLAFVVPFGDGPLSVDWEKCEPASFKVDELEKAGIEGAQYAAVPDAAARAKNYEEWKKQFSQWLFSSRSLSLFSSRRLKLVSSPGEDEAAFRARIAQTVREKRDEAVASLQEKYAPKARALQEKIRRAEEATQRERSQASQSQLQTALSVGATLLGAFLGKKALSASTLGRATTAARGAGRAYKESQDVGRAQENVEAARRQLEELNAELQAELSAVASAKEAEEPLETVAVRPNKSRITVQLVCLLWVAT
jgi:hypothetical protein